MNSLWLIITSIAAFAVAYRLYGAFLAAKVAVLNDARTTPAHRLNDGVDFHPTNKVVLFGHHFAAIAGPGPLIGPVIAAQWGFLPGFIWIIIGACLAGAVHDFVVLLASVRMDGKTLPNIARTAHGPASGLITSITTLFIIVITLAAVATVVVAALNKSAWGMFTIIVTIPAALITGLWMYKIRPGKVAEASFIGVTIVMLGVIFGKNFAESSIAHTLIFSKESLSIMLPVYALIASILPVWVLMCPRDYLSSYMKIGVMIVLGVGIVIAAPELKMPALTPLIDGGPGSITGPVWPFVCIVIMCGAISGFHALIASGTTPRMLNKESDIRPIGYGAMVLEGFVAVTALVAACALEPGDYFAINFTPDQVANVVAHNPQWNLATVQLHELEAATDEKLVGRAGGAVTLAVGMAKIFASLPGMKTLTNYWYHFVIMFEALFILTLLETGTRVARFVVQEMLVTMRPSLRAENKPNWTVNAITSVAVCAGWGSLLYIGTLTTLWGMLGIVNQLLATIGLAVGTTYLLTHAPRRWHALLTVIPLVFIVVTVYVAGWMSVQMWWAAAGKEAMKIAVDGKGGPDMQKIFLFKLMCFLATGCLILTAVILIDAVRKWREILAKPHMPIAAAAV